MAKLSNKTSYLGCLKKVNIIILCHLKVFLFKLFVFVFGTSHNLRIIMI